MKSLILSISFLDCFDIIPTVQYRPIWIESRRTRRYSLFMSVIVTTIIFCCLIRFFSFLHVWYSLLSSACSLLGIQNLFGLCQLSKEKISDIARFFYLLVCLGYGLPCFSFRRVWRFLPRRFNTKSSTPDQANISHLGMCPASNCLFSFWDPRIVLAVVVCNIPTFKSCIIIESKRALFSIDSNPDHRK